MAFRILVTGSRDWDCDALAQAILAGLKAVRKDPIIVVDGACHVGNGGVDGAFHRAARNLGLETERWAAETFGPWPACGPIRNSFMVERGADLGIACHPNLRESRGTLDCVRKMLAAGIPVILHESEYDMGGMIWEGFMADLLPSKSE
jgi:hypothetical protein